MWGLILKDIYSSKRMLIQNLLVVLAGFIMNGVMAFMLKEEIKEEPVIYVLFFVMIEVMVLFAAFMICGSMLKVFFSEDEKVDWQNYLVSTPIMIRKQVLVKYLEIITLYGACLLYGVLLNLYIGKICGLKLSNKITLALFLFFLLQSIVELPFLFKAGSRYGNYIKTYFCLIIVFVIILYGLYGTLPAGINQDKIVDFCARLAMGEPEATKYFKTVKDFAEKAMPIFTIILCLASYFISCKLFNPDKTIDKE